LIVKKAFLLFNLQKTIAGPYKKDQKSGEAGRRDVKTARPGTLLKMLLSELDYDNSVTIKLFSK